MDKSVKKIKITLELPYNEKYNPLWISGMLNTHQQEIVDFINGLLNEHERK